MKPRFRDRSNRIDLPPIPHELIDELKRLDATILQADGLTLFARLEAIYRYIDKFNAFVATFSVCQKGCSHCCRFDIQVSRLEAEYIAVGIGRGFDHKVGATQGHTSNCPFLLENGECSIYEHRPFNCRTFHTLDDPKYCADGVVNHQVYGASGLGYGVGPFMAIAEWLKAVHVGRGLEYRDIRDWFPETTATRQKSFMSRLIEFFGRG